MLDFLLFHVFIDFVVFVILDYCLSCAVVIFNYFSLWVVMILHYLSSCVVVISFHALSDFGFFVMRGCEF